MPFAAVLSFHRYSGCLPPRSFIHVFPFWGVRYLFLSARPFNVPSPRCPWSDFS
jgi:hypothetical protein